MKRIGKGLIVNFTEGEKGFVPYRRLVNTVHTRDNEDIVEIINKKFPLGSVHKCRVLDYILMDMLYVCTFEKEELQEKIFSVSDLEVGKQCKIKVEAMKSAGIVVRAGKVTGFVTNLHLGDVKYSENIKKKYKIGQSVLAKLV